MTPARTLFAFISAIVGTAVLTAGPMRAVGQQQNEPTGPATTANISDYYDIETIQLPEGDPSADGIGIMPDGRVVVSFYNGNVSFYAPARRRGRCSLRACTRPLEFCRSAITKSSSCRCPR